MLNNEPGRILKAVAMRGHTSAVAFNFDDLRRQCDEYLVQVRKEADEIVRQARREAEQVRTTAGEEGRKTGLAEGLQQAEKKIADQAAQLARQQVDKELAAVLPALRDLSQRLLTERDRWLSRWEEAGIQLSVAIAERLLRATLKTQPAQAVEMLKDALRMAVGQSHVRLFVHPDVLEIMGDQAAQMTQALSAGGAAELIADETLSVGDCRIETEQGEINAEITVMLDRIVAELIDAD